MDIIDIIKKINDISNKTEGKTYNESKLIMVDEIIKLHKRINLLEDELKYTFERINELKNNRYYDSEELNVIELKEQNELLIRENFNLIMKLRKNTLIAK